MSELWLASTDEENWSGAEEYSTREEALENFPVSFDLTGGRTFYTGLKHQVTLSDVRSCFTPCSPLEMISEAAYEHEMGGGEYAEDWPDMDDSDEEELREKIADTIQTFLTDKCLTPYWFTVLKMKTHQVLEVPK